MAPATPADTAMMQRLESTDEIPPEELNSKYVFFLTCIGKHFRPQCQNYGCTLADNSHFIFLFIRIIDIQAMTLPERMTMIRNSGVYVQSLTSLVDNLVGPTLQMLVDRDQYNKNLVSDGDVFLWGCFPTKRWEIDSASF